MKMSTLSLKNDHLLVEIDPGRGADVLRLQHVPTGVNVLFSTPWRERADDIRTGLHKATSSDSMVSWLEQYRGGWQTLCPNAGDPRVISGSPVGYHGEASITEWTVETASSTMIRLANTLFSVPVRIQREITIVGTSLTTLDTLTNLSDVELEFDYVHHPVFGGEFLEGPCRIDAGARQFISDWETSDAITAPGSEHDWPVATDQNGVKFDLREIPARPVPRTVFGWLTDFETHWASITNVNLGLCVRLEWEGEHLPHAWLWQELNNSTEWPWFRQARVVAIEPASTETSGPGRRSVLTLASRASIQIPLTIAVAQKVAPL